MDSANIRNMKRIAGDAVNDEKIYKNQRDINELIRKIESVNEKCIKLGMQ